LKAVAVIEKDINNDLFTWCFPSLDEHEQVIKVRSGLMDRDWNPKFRFAKLNDVWHYMQSATLQLGPKNKYCTGFCVVILSTTYHPQKYEAMVKLLAKMYLESQSTMPIMQAYLSIFTSGKVSTTLGDFEDAKFNQRVFISPVKKIFELFGVEFIVIWNAVLLRQRIFVYSDKLDEVLGLIKALPLIGAWHRQDWDILRPFVTLSEIELKDLRDAGVYIAGFTDASCVQKKDYYDLYVDVPARSLTIADHAKDAFRLTKFHKTTAEQLVALAAEQPDKEIITGVAKKTNELRKKIETLGDDLTLEKLAEMKLPPNMDRFLYNVAKAEGLLKDTDSGAEPSSNEQQQATTESPTKEAPTSPEPTPATTADDTDL